MNNLNEATFKIEDFPSNRRENRTHSAVILLFLPKISINVQQLVGRCISNVPYLSANSWSNNLVGVGNVWCQIPKSNYLRVLWCSCTRDIRTPLQKVKSAPVQLYSFHSALQSLKIYHHLAVYLFLIQD